MADGAEYDLEERTFQFALSIRRCIAGRKWNREQWTDVDQLLRSSGSVAANYIEANNAVSKPDFLLRIRISKKEASETRLWLRLLGETSSDDTLKQTLRQLYRESDELSRILATILRNSQK
ncbi:MAG: four helix bundle protein [Akkermansiaceae bacterium]|nr:four helix bundle protein [Akkermansiaceae bacterium]